MGLNYLDYKHYVEIIKLEIQLTKKSQEKFINIEEEKKFYHIYLGKIDINEGQKT